MGQSLPPGATEREVKMWTEDILNHLEAAGVGTCGTDCIGASCQTARSRVVP